MHSWIHVHTYYIHIGCYYEPGARFPDTDANVFRILLSAIFQLGAVRAGALHFVGILAQFPARNRDISRL